MRQESLSRLGEEARRPALSLSLSPAEEQERRVMMPPSNGRRREGARQHSDARLVNSDDDSRSVKQSLAVPAAASEREECAREDGCRAIQSILPSQ